MRQAHPDPDKAVDIADFIDLLNELRAWAGNPSYRTLAKKVGPLMRPPQTLSQSTLGEAFQPRRRRLNLDLVVAIARALGLAENDVARWRAACVRVHADAKSGGPTGVLRQLPAGLATFTGREAELNRLRQAVTARDGEAAPTVVISAIEGMGGVGKTQLAVRVAHQLVQEGRYADLQLFVNLRGFDAEQEPADPADVLGAFLRALGVPPRQIPDGLEERAAMFRDRIAGRPAVIVLDNAADEEQIRHLVPASPTCLVLITSRRSLIGLEHADLHLLDVFTPAEGVELLRRVAGAERVDAEPEAAAGIVDACGRLPLAVALAASRLRSRPTWTLAHLAERLRVGAINTLRTADQGLRPVFDMSLQGLDPPERRVFTLLGLHPGPDFAAPAVAALTGLDAATAESLLERLLDEHLLEQRTVGRYEFHDLLRVYSAGQAAEAISADERDSALRRLLTWYLLTMDAAGRQLKAGRVLPEFLVPEGCDGALDFATPGDAAAWCEREIANLVRGAEESAALNLPVLSWRLPMTVSTFLGFSANWREWERLHLSGLACARRSGDLVGESKMLSGLGISAERLGDLAGAESHLEAALDLTQRLDDPRGTANVLSALGTIYSASGRAELGLAAAERAFSIGREIGNSDVERLALQNSSGCLLALNRPADARDRLLEAAELYRKAGDELGLGLVMGNVGYANNLLGAYEEAEEAYAEYLVLSRKVRDRHGQTQALCGLAKVRIARGQLDEARRLLEEALVILDALGSAEAAVVRAQLGTAELAVAVAVAVEKETAGAAAS